MISIAIRNYKRVNHRPPRPILWVVPATIAIALLAYSQSVAYFGNETFHLLAAQLINAGKKPYLEFFYQHPPLFAYLTAAWMRAFGENWRSAHVLSALLTSGCIVVITNYVYSRSSDSPLRRAIAGIAAALLGLNFFVVSYGTVGLPFGLVLFLSAVAFRVTVAAAYRDGLLLPLLAGLAAGSASASSLLTASEPLVLAAWLAWYRPRGARLRVCLSFVVGVVLPFFPLILLGLSAPRPVFFDLVEYHLFHRVGAEGNMLRWNLREILDWFGSIQGLVLVGMAIIGILFTVKRSDLQKERKEESYLCAWLTLVLSVYLATPRPTFSFYFVIVTPFVVVLAATGLEVMSTLDWFFQRKRWLIPALVLLYAVGLGWQVYKMRREILYADHKSIEAIAREVNQVTPADGWVFAFEQVYFEARRLPPPGLENGFNPYSRAGEWLAGNRFATVCIMANDPRVKSLNLFGRYAKNKAFTNPNFTVYLFWDRVVPSTEPR